MRTMLGFRKCVGNIISIVEVSQLSIGDGVVSQPDMKQRVGRGAGGGASSSKVLVIIGDEYS